MLQDSQLSLIKIKRESLSSKNGFLDVMSRNDLVRRWIDKKGIRGYNESIKLSTHIKS